MSYKVNVGARIRARRMELGVTQTELSRLLGYTSRSSLNKIETGKNALQTELILVLAEKLRTTPAYLLASVEQNLYVLGFQVTYLDNGVVRVSDDMHPRAARFTPECWRVIEEQDELDIVVAFMQSEKADNTTLYTKEMWDEVRRAHTHPDGGQKEKPLDQKAEGLRDAGYYELNPANRAMIDSLIDSLLKSQSAE